MSNPISYREEALQQSKKIMKVYHVNESQLGENFTTEIMSGATGHVTITQINERTWFFDIWVKSKQGINAGVYSLLADDLFTTDKLRAIHSICTAYDGQVRLELRGVLPSSPKSRLALNILTNVSDSFQFAGNGLILLDEDEAITTQLTPAYTTAVTAEEEEPEP